ncbi:MAG: cation:proton antiporter [bacterium]|jgi:Kef-type K+ transport system membrane component KefB
MTVILFSLCVIYIAAQVGAEIAQRLKMPAVVGEIAAGAIIGPFALGWAQKSEPLEVLAEIGAVLLLFSVGLETKLGDLKKVGAVAGMVGVAGVIFPFVLGASWAHFSGFAWNKALFVAAAFVATSAGITARVLKDLGALGRIESRVILGAAVIDDILAMLLLGVVSALQGGQGVNFASLAWVLVQALGFVIIIALVGTRLMRKQSSLLDAPINPLSPLTLCLAGCLVLAACAAYIGLAAIIGAFLAGMVAAESKQRHALEEQIIPIMAFIVPFFFILTGMQVDVRALGNTSALIMLLVVTVLAIIGKLVGCGLGALKLGPRSAAIVGTGMVPRGEVGIIVAALGKSAGVFNDTVYAIIIAMSLLTSIIAPPVLAALLAKTPEPLTDVPPDDTDESLLLSVDESGHK